MAVEPVWTEGVMEDGAALLRHGTPMTISYVLAALNRAEAASAPAPAAPDPTGLPGLGLHPEFRRGLAFAEACQRQADADEMETIEVLRERLATHAAEVAGLRGRIARALALLNDVGAPLPDRVAAVHAILSAAAMPRAAPQEAAEGLAAPEAAPPPREPPPAALGAPLCGCLACQREARTAAEAAAQAPRATLADLLHVFFAPGWRYACDVCGNKRCPRHADHRLACSGSNAPGQAGSGW